MGTPSKIAILIDFENLEAGVRKQFDAKAEVEPIIDKMSEVGVAVMRRAYGDWVQHGSYRHSLVQCGVELVERPNVSPGRNGADIKLAIDAVEAALRNNDWDHFVIVTGNSDFLPLVHKLRELNRTVTIIGVEGSTSNMLKKNCDQYYPYDDLASLRQATQSISTDSIRLLERAIVSCGERHEQILVADLRQQLQQLDSSFSEIACGFESFKDLLDFVATNRLIPIEVAFEDAAWHVNVTGKIVLKSPPTASRGANRGRRDQRDHRDHRDQRDHKPRDGGKRKRPEKKEPEQQWEERPLEPDEWKVFIEAVQKCIDEGAGRPNQGKLWIINAYLHRQRLDGKLPLANQVLFDALQLLANNGVLAHPSQDTFLLPEDFDDKRESFLKNLDSIVGAALPPQTKEAAPAEKAPAKPKAKPDKADAADDDEQDDDDDDDYDDDEDDEDDDDDRLPVPRKDLPDFVKGQEDLYTPEELEEILEAEREYAAKAREEAQREKAKNNPRSKGRSKGKPKPRPKGKRTTRRKS